MTEPATKTFTEDQIIDAVLDMMKRQSFANWYNGDGAFARWIEGINAPTDENIRQQLKSLLRVPLQTVAR